MNFERLRLVPFLLWIVFFAIGVAATLSNPRREGSGFKGIHSDVAVAGESHALDMPASALSKK